MNYSGGAPSAARTPRAAGSYCSGVSCAGHVNGVAPAFEQLCDFTACRCPVRAKIACEGESYTPGEEFLAPYGRLHACVCGMRSSGVSGACWEGAG